MMNSLFSILSQGLSFLEETATFNPVIGEGGSDIVEAVSEAAQQTGQQSVMGTQSLLSILLLYGAMIFLLWFFLWRPQKKRDKQMNEMRDSLKVGDKIVTSSGFFGKIISVGHDSFVIEFGADTGRGIRVPVRKSDVTGVKEPVLTPPPVDAVEEKPKKWWQRAQKDQKSE